MMQNLKITGNLVNAYFVCPRKLWLYAHEISPDPEWEFLELGRLISEQSYKREKRELEIGGMKIDILQRRDGEVIVGEIKKSSKGLKPGKMQLLFYLYKLKQYGVEMKGELLIPKERKRIKVELDETLERELKNAIEEMQKIMKSDEPPEPKRTWWCSKCAYFEFCWS